MAEIDLKPLDKFLKKLETGLEKVNQGVADDVLKGIASDMLGPKTGLFFGERTRRSAPGEAPAVQSQELIKSLFNKQLAPKMTKKWIIAKQAVGTPLGYGYDLEVGPIPPKDGFGWVKKRPFLGPGLARITMKMYVKRLRSLIV